MILYRKSLLCMEKEKMWILNKELKYLYLICDFYSVGNNSTSGEKKDLEHSFNILKRQIEELRENLEENFEALKKQIEYIELLKNNIYEIQSLIYIDMLREYIRYKVEKIDLISIKISQLLRDGYNQYIPKPIVGKRHSSVNITSQVEFLIKRTLKELQKLQDKEATIEPIIVWDYNDEYKILNFSDKSMILNLSYWYFEFSYFLPNLTHEIGHHFQKINMLDSNIIKKEIYKSTDKFYISKEDYTHIKNVHKILSEEILADLIALLYHGDSYIYALSHKLLGEKLSNTFHSINRDNVYDNNNKIMDMKNVRIDNSFTISRYKFNLNRDLIFIRLYIILKIRDIVIDKNLIQKYLVENNMVELKRLLNSIYHIDDKFENFDLYTSSCLNDVYKDYHNYRGDYNKVKEIIKNVCNDLVEFFKKNRYIEKIIQKVGFSKKEKQETKYKTIPIYFNDIWHKRFEVLKENKTIHRFEYRKQLHQFTLEKLIDNGYLEEKNIIPYSMVFLKFRIDRLMRQPIKFKKNIKSGRVLGIYDYVYFRKLDTKFKIDKFYPLYDEENKDIKYYESSYSLMKILNDTKGNKNTNEKNALNAIIQVEISKNLENSNNNKDIYENLYEDLVNIHNIFEDEFENDKDKYYTIEYFKSLGPKDITIVIEFATINFIFKVKKTLYNRFKRTFTTFYLNNEVDTSKIVSNKRNPFVSYLRMNPNYDNKNFEEKCRKYKSYIKIIFLKTGVMDFRIVWNSGVTLKELHKFYDELLIEKMVSDIQTSIDENIL